MTTKKKRLANQLTQLINSKLEKQLKAEIQLFFQKQMDEVLSAFDEYYTDTLLLQGHINLILSPIHELQKEYYDLLLKYNTEIYNRGKEQGRRQVDGMALKSAKPLKWHHDENKPTDLFGTLPTSEQHLTSYTFTASESTMNRVDGEINRILTEGYRDGLGVKDVRNRIMERYQQFTGWEANRIARTEMQTAHNMGVMQTYQEMGVQYKEWRSAHDKRTRRSHSLLDGEIVKVGDKFSNGLMFPGDKSGPIEEWINCRCSVVPYLMSPGTSAPVGRSQFRADDFVSVSEPDYNQLLREHTQGAIDWEQYQQILHGKTLEQVGIGAVVQQTKEEPTIEEQLTADELKQYRKAQQDLKKATAKLEKLADNDPRRIMFESRIKSANRTIKKYEKIALDSTNRKVVKEHTIKKGDKKNSNLRYEQVTTYEEMADYFGLTYVEEVTIQYGKGTRRPLLYDEKYNVRFSGMDKFDLNETKEVLRSYERANPLLKTSTTGIHLDPYTDKKTLGECNPASNHITIYSHKWDSYPATIEYTVNHEMSHAFDNLLNSNFEKHFSQESKEYRKLVRQEGWSSKYSYSTKGSTRIMEDFAETGAMVLNKNNPNIRIRLEDGSVITAKEWCEMFPKKTEFFENLLNSKDAKNLLR